MQFPYEGIVSKCISQQGNHIFATRNGNNTVVSRNVSDQAENAFYNCPGILATTAWQ
jgi:hypothetical protein